MRMFSGTVKNTLRTIFHYTGGSFRIALLMAAGDVLMQHYINYKEDNEVNWQRTIKFAAIGVCFMGPVLIYWKRNISDIVRASRSHTTRALKQLFWDQIYLAPSINLGIISLSGALEKESIQDIENRISLYFPYIIKRHYMIWPGVQFFGSFCIQPTLRVYFANIIAIFWYAYISGILHRDEIFDQTPTNIKN